MDIDSLVANCEKEDLHLSGKIQSFGALMMVETESFSILYVSENIDQFTPTEARALLGTSLTQVSWFPINMLSTLGHDVGNRLLINDHPIGDSLKNVRLIRTEGAVTIEIEPSTEAAKTVSESALESALYPLTNEVWQEQEYYDALLKNLGSFMPFSRIMLYRFQHDWVGEVVAEFSHFEEYPYIGLKFPASDIPAIARQMYFENPSRVINDAQSQSVNIIGLPKQNIDLTHSDLRSVSPVHAEYMNNMSVRASFSLPVIISGKLWGIVSCHNKDAMLVSAYERCVAERLTRSFGALFSSFLVTQRMRLLSTIDARLSGLHDKLVENKNRGWERHFADALCLHLDGVSAAIVNQGQWSITGDSPDKNTLEKIDFQLRQDTQSLVHYTQNVREWIEKEWVSDPKVRGVLLIRDSFETHGVRGYIFRTSEIQHHSWAGNPDKRVSGVDANGKLSPRSSFQKWTETLGHMSLPWNKEDLLVAKKLRSILLSFMKDHIK